MLHHHHSSQIHTVLKELIETFDGWLIELSGQIDNDIPLYVQAFTLQALTQYTPHSFLCEKHIEKIAQILISQFHPQTLSWNYYHQQHPLHGTVPDDIDDTSLIAIALQTYTLSTYHTKNRTSERKCSEQIFSAIHTIQTNIHENGVYTWCMRPTKDWLNTDIVVQAQALRFLETCGLSNSRLIHTICTAIDSVDVKSSFYISPFVVFYFLSYIRNKTVQESCLSYVRKFLLSTDMKSLSFLDQACFVIILQRFRTYPDIENVVRRIIPSFIKRCSDIHFMSKEERVSIMSCPMYAESSIILGGKKRVFYAQYPHITTAICVEIFHHEIIERSGRAATSIPGTNKTVTAPLLRVCRDLLHIMLNQSTIPKDTYRFYAQFLEVWWRHQEQQDNIVDRKKYTFNTDPSQNLQQKITRRLKAIETCMLPYIILFRESKEKALLAPLISFIRIYLELRQAADDILDIDEDINFGRQTLVTAYIHAHKTRERACKCVIRIMQRRLKKLTILLRNIPNPHPVLLDCIRNIKGQLWKARVRRAFLRKV